MRIVPPDVQSPRVRFADWIEVLALTSDLRECRLRHSRTYAE